MLECIAPCVERAGLRNAMKILHQKYPETPGTESGALIGPAWTNERPGSSDTESNDNDTDSEKRKQMSGAGDQVAQGGSVTRQGALGSRNRQLSTDTIKVRLILASDWSSVPDTGL